MALESFARRARGGDLSALWFVCSSAQNVCRSLGAVYGARRQARDGEGDGRPACRPVAAASARGTPVLPVLPGTQAASKLWAKFPCPCVLQLRAPLVHPADRSAKKTASLRPAARAVQPPDASSARNLAGGTGEEQCRCWPWRRDGLCGGRFGRRREGGSGERGGSRWGGGV